MLDEEGTTDILASTNSFDKDNLYVLKADMTSAVVDTGEQCDPSSNDTGTCNLPDNNTIVLNGTSFQIKSYGWNNTENDCCL